MQRLRRTWKFTSWDKPDVRKLHKDDLLRFTGTLNGYQPEPFLLTWDDAMINQQDLTDLTAPAPAGAGRGRGAQ